jgi:hypothetical protein
MTRVRFPLVLLAVAVVTFAPAASSAADPQLVPVPDMYYGGWWRHGISLTIARNENLPEAPLVIAEWRTYKWCSDPLTQKPSPPPCDSTISNLIENGGIARIATFHYQGQDDRNLSGVVVATSDPSGVFGDWKGSVQFTMLPGKMLLVEAAKGSMMFCGPDTDYSQYPPNPCGA